MFHFAKISLHLISLILGVGLIIFIKNQTKVKSIWPKIAAWFAIILSVLSIICSIIWTIKHWNTDYFMHKHQPHHEKPQDSFYRHIDR